MDDPCEGAGCVIGFENQALGEEIDITGTPYFLRYNSERQKGRTSNRSLTLTLTEATIPASLKRIEVQIMVAGREFDQTFPATASQSFTFTWDGLDAYGRAVQGRQLATADVGYVYDGSYQQTGAFGYNGNGTPITGDKTRKEITLHRIFRNYVGTFNAAGLGLGGWMLSVHHFYDTTERVLYEGDGARRSVQSISTVITTSAGNGASGFFGDGGPATKASCGSSSPQGVSVASDGSVYAADTGSRVIRRIAPDGTISTVAGTPNVLCTPTTDPCGDGSPALQAKFSAPVSTAVGPDGSYYIADPGAFRVRKVNPNGIITTVAGNGQACSSPTAACGDGGPGPQAQLNSNQIVVAAPDGTIYITDGNDHRVRRVGADGIITTVAGSGNAPSSSCNNNGVPALQACLGFPFGLAVLPDGSIYFADGQLHQVFRVQASGIINVVAGDTTCGSNGDAGPAINARLCNPEGVTRAPDNSILISDWGNSRIRRIGTDGIITTIAGNGSAGFGGDGGPALQGQIRNTIGVTYGLDGSFYIADANNRRIRRVAPTLSGFTAADIAVPSADGNELYVFNSVGRHLRTVNTLTNTNEYVFTYDGAGRLTQVTDGDGNVTTIERDASANPTGILSPYNQLTTLSLDANGYLSAIANPANETNQFTYSADGLMTLEKNPRNNQNTFTYDSFGRLISDADAANDSQTLASTVQGGTSNVTQSTALNRTTTYQVQNLANGDRKEINTSPDGTQIQATEGANGTNSNTYPDGTVTSETLGADPRWQMQAPLTTKSSTSVPLGPLSNLTNSSIFSRNVTLANPSDLLSLTSQTDTLNVNGRVYTSTYTASTRTFNFTTPVGRQSTSAIDTLGRTTNRQFANLNPESFGYDSRGRLSMVVLGSGNSARAFNYAYNSSGFVASVADPLGRSSSFNYDAAGRVTQQTFPGNRVIGYSYDANGNITSVMPPGRPAHSFTYNSLDLITSYTAPSLGAGSTQTLYNYDADRQLTQITRPDAQTINFAYDAAGRLSGSTVPTGAYSYTYDATTGNLKTATAPGGSSLSYSYVGYLLNGLTWNGPVHGTVSFNYNNDFRVSSENLLGVTGGSLINFSYDNDNLLTSAGPGPVSGRLQLARDPQTGLLTGTTLGNLTDTINYDGFAEPTGYTAKYNGTNVDDVQYTYDKLGRITQKVETIGGTTTTLTYGYDQAGRLQTVTPNNDSSQTISYSYDSNNNRIGMTAGGTTTNPTYDAQDRLTQYGLLSYSYTANGELQSKTQLGQTTQYSYDVLGNLLSVTLPDATHIDYVIDAQNRRIGKKVNGSLVEGLLYHSQLAPAAELDGNGNVISRFVYGSRSNTPDFMIKPDAVNGDHRYRIISDHLGSPRLVIDADTGVLMQRIDYDEFGVVLMDTNPGFQPFGFAGGLYDPRTGLVRFGARDYDAQIGRWTAKDPDLFDGGDTNVYNYALSDPINRGDRDGRGALGWLISHALDQVGIKTDPNDITGAGAISLLKSKITEKQNEAERLEAEIARLKKLPPKCRKKFQKTINDLENQVRQIRTVDIPALQDAINQVEQIVKFYDALDPTDPNNPLNQGAHRLQHDWDYFWKSGRLPSYVN